MKTTLYEKVKYLAERLFFHGSKFVKDAGEVFKNRITVVIHIIDAETLLTVIKG